MIPRRVARPVSTLSPRRGKLSPSLPSLSSSHRNNKYSLGARTWHALAVFAVLTASPLATRTTSTTARAFATDPSPPNRTPTSVSSSSSAAALLSNGRTMAFHGKGNSRGRGHHDSPTAFSMSSQRLESPSAERNKEPIWDVLSSKILPRLRNENTNNNNNNNNNEPWKILEIAAGAGVHTEHLASRILDGCDYGSRDDDPPPPFVWYPTDPTEEALASIRSRTSSANLGTVVAPPEAVTLGASGICQEQARNRLLSLSPDSDSNAYATTGNEGRFDVILCINMIHISPWEATLGLMNMAGKHLKEPEQEDSDDGGGYLYCYGPYRHEGKVVPSNENFDRSLKSRNPEWGVRNLRDVINAADREGLELVECIDMPSNNNSLIFCRRRRRKPVRPDRKATNRSNPWQDQF